VCNRKTKEGVIVTLLSHNEFTLRVRNVNATSLQPETRNVPPVHTLS